MRLTRATIARILSSEDKLQIVELAYDTRACDTAAASDSDSNIAYNYLELNSPLQPGDNVLVNTTAVDLNLGTGGVHFVLPEKALDVDSSGHIIKLRYTSLQRNVLAVEEPRSPHHATLAEAQSLEGMPVICCSLHSQVPLVAAALRAQMPEAKIAYCMTDESALMLSYSHIIRSAKNQGLLDTTISCGQAIGGDFEAVTLFSGLLTARHVARADAAIVSIGPGTVGTNTAFGTTGLAQGVALNAVASLSGAPIAALRVSFADNRARHFGISHHCLTALKSVCLTEAVLALPDYDSLPHEQSLMIEQTLQAEQLYQRHAVIRVPITRENIDLRDLEVTTMGRSEACDPAFFRVSYAAGIFAGMLLNERR